MACLSPQRRRRRSRLHVDSGPHGASKPNQVHHDVPVSIRRDGQADGRRLCLSADEAVLASTLVAGEARAVHEPHIGTIPGERHDRRGPLLLVAKAVVLEGIAAHEPATLSAPSGRGRGASRWRRAVTAASQDLRRVQTGPQASRTPVSQVDLNTDGCGSPRWGRCPLRQTIPGPWLGRSLFRLHNSA